jgi:hypothetical protein
VSSPGIPLVAKPKQLRPLHSHQSVSVNDLVAIGSAQHPRDDPSCVTTRNREFGLHRTEEIRCILESCDQKPPLT